MPVPFGRAHAVNVSYDRCLRVIFVHWFGNVWRRRLWIILNASVCWFGINGNLWRMLWILLNWFSGFECGLLDDWAGRCFWGCFFSGPYFSWPCQTSWLQTCSQWSDAEQNCIICFLYCQEGSKIANADWLKFSFSYWLVRLAVSYAVYWKLDPNKTYRIWWNTIHFEACFSSANVSQSCEVGVPKPVLLKGSFSYISSISHA